MHFSLSSFIAGAVSVAAPIALWLTIRRGEVIYQHLLHKLEDEKFRQAVSKRPKRIILIRHGESEGNIKHDLYSNIADHQIPLTDKGTQQCLEAGRKLKELVKDESVCFFVSPYKRTRQTFEGLAASFSPGQYRVKYEPRLREQEWGFFPSPDLVKACREQRDKVGAFYYRFPNGESGADVFDRVSTFLETLYRDFERSDCDQNVVLVSHGLTCRLFLTRYYHWDIEYFHSLQNFDNCQFAVMERQPSGRYELTEPLKTWKRECS